MSNRNLIIFIVVTLVLMLPAGLVFIRVLFGLGGDFPPRWRFLFDVANGYMITAIIALILAWVTHSVRWGSVPFASAYSGKQKVIVFLQKRPGPNIS